MKQKQIISTEDYRNFFLFYFKFWMSHFTLILVLTIQNKIEFYCTCDVESTLCLTSS